MSDYIIRSATPEDAGIIAKHRVSMFRDMGNIPSEELAASLQDESVTALDAELRSGMYVGWLAATPANEIIAGVGVHIKPQLPRTAPNSNKVATGPVPLVVNMYVEPAWRLKGIARALMTTLMQWATDRGFDRVLLHASDDGRALYTSLGFVQSNEMRWFPKL